MLFCATQYAQLQFVRISVYYICTMVCTQRFFFSRLIPPDYVLIDESHFGFCFLFCCLFLTPFIGGFVTNICVIIYVMLYTCSVHSLHKLYNYYCMKEKDLKKESQVSLQNTPHQIP